LYFPGPGELLLTFSIGLDLKEYLGLFSKLTGL
jgi:hypothetical protein